MEDPDKVIPETQLGKLDYNDHEVIPETQLKELDYNELIPKTQLGDLNHNNTLLQAILQDQIQEEQTQVDLQELCGRMNLGLIEDVEPNAPGFNLKHN